MKTKIAIAIASILSTGAFAGEQPKPNPDPAPVFTEQQQAAISAAVSAAIARSQSTSAAGALAEGGAGGAGGAGGDAEAAGGAAEALANGEVNIGGDTSKFSSKALALGQLRAFPAPVPGKCQETTAGWDITVASRTGRVKREVTCAEEERCFRLAEVYFNTGYEQAMLDTLATKPCGGIKLTAQPKAKEEKVVFTGLTEEQVRAIASEYATKAFKTTVSK